jgi:hypothetical protein
MNELFPNAPEEIPMDTAMPAQPHNDAHQELVSAVARQVELMSKEEVQALLAKATVELQNENSALKKQIEKLEADKVRLYYQVGRLSFDPEEWEKTFDPRDYTVPAEEMLAEARKLVQGS